MPAAVTTSLEPGESTWKIGLLFSGLFHLTLFIGIPVCMALARNNDRFERPQTFQLVTAPSSLKSFTPPSQRKLTKQVRRTVKKEASRPVPSRERVSKVGEFKYNWYLANIQKKISSFWNPPTENRGISVEVAFTVHRDGSITEPRLAKPSGNGTLDNLAMRAVNLAAPFGKMPPGFSGNKIELTVTLIPTLN
jgi:TonB family protein